MPAICILIAQSHEMIRESPASMIEGIADLEIVGQTNNGKEAIRLCEEWTPDVILIGLYLQGLDSLITTRLISETLNRPHIIMIDSLYGEEHEQSARKAGVDAYFELDVKISEIVDEMRASTR